LFTGRGTEFGYPDHAIDPDTFEYSGEGLVGDMEMTFGNKAIVERSPNLHLFETIGGGIVRYVGLFQYDSHRLITTRDTKNVLRSAILFTLKRVIED